MNLSRRRKLRYTPKLSLIVLWVIVLMLALIWSAPFVFMIFTSFKSNGELLRGSAFALPKTLLWSNYGKAWEISKLAQYGLNSLVITIAKVPIGILISSMAAFALTRSNLRFRRPIFLLIIMGTMIPVQVAIIPLFDIIVKANLLNTYVGVLLPYIAFGIPYQVFMLRGFFNDIPRELDEAARLDGASNIDIFLQVIIPISLPILTALFILDFVATWNEFGIALVVLPSPEAWTIPLGLQAFQGQFATQYNLLNAAVVMSILPVIIVYVLFQRYFVAGLTAGAVKG